MIYVIIILPASAPSRTNGPGWAIHNSYATVGIRRDHAPRTWERPERDPHASLCTGTPFGTAPLDVQLNIDRGGHPLFLARIAQADQGPARQGPAMKSQHYIMLVSKPTHPTINTPRLFVTTTTLLFVCSNKLAWRDTNPPTHPAHSASTCVRTFLVNAEIGQTSKSHAQSMHEEPAILWMA